MLTWITSVNWDHMWDGSGEEKQKGEEFSHSLPVDYVVVENCAMWVIVLELKIIGAEKVTSQGSENLQKADTWGVLMFPTDGEKTIVLVETLDDVYA